MTVLADAQTGWGQITEVWSGYDGGKVLFRMSIDHIDPVTIDCNAKTFYSVDPDTADANKFLSILLSAQATKSQVSVMLSDVVCYSGYPSALRLGVKT